MYIDVLNTLITACQLGMFTLNFDCKMRMDHQKKKKSYENRVYKSVDDRSPS